MPPQRSQSVPMRSRLPMTRSRSAQLLDSVENTHESQAGNYSSNNEDETAPAKPKTPAVSISQPAICVLPEKLTGSLTKLGQKNHALLLKKQHWLRHYQVVVPRRAEAVVSVAAASLVFAQEEAGTAVCISPLGLLLTCSHCVAETAVQLDKSKSRWLLFASGAAVQARCIAWDAKRDLALLQIVAAQAQHRKDGAGDNSAEERELRFPFVTLASSSPNLKTKLCCIGHPGSEDLEASQPGIQTNYDVLHISAGEFRGFAAGQDLHDNSEIGALMHDCWTYWGHSGAPIVESNTGKLIGLHSSWDDETCMRRGIALEAILEFLKTHDVLGHCS